MKEYPFWTLKLPDPVITVMMNHIIKSTKPPKIQQISKATEVVMEMARGPNVPATW